MTNNACPESAAATRRKTLRPVAIVSIALLAWLTGTSNLAANQIADRPLTLAVSSFQPNILLILDNSESNQEGVDGRTALNWDVPACRPGRTDINPANCPAGAAHPESKASIVKDVGQFLVDSYRDSVNMGLMAYQQHPARANFDDALDPANPANRGTVRWRIYHRPLDVRYSNTPNPTWYDPNFQGAWNDPTKRYRDVHPLNPNIYMFYNDAVPGYERSDFTEFCRMPQPPQFTNNDAAQRGECFNNVSVGFGGALSWGTRVFNGSIFLVDSLRQRNIPQWGTHVNYSQLNQWEWRATRSPGLGYLHVPIGGRLPNGQVDNDHWSSIEKKLAPHRTDWQPSDGNVMVDPEWPLIAAGLTPLEGTMQTATQYFLESGGQNSGAFGPNQGWRNSLPPIPESCGVNAAIWVTDGLPSVSATGTPLGDDLPAALETARQSIANFYSATEAGLGNAVRTFIVGFALPPGVANIPNLPEDPLDVLAQAGGTDQALMAADREGLRQTLSDLFQQIIADSQIEIGSQVTGSVQLDDAIGFRFESDPSNWSGEMVGLRNPNLPAEQEIWRASEQLPLGSNRNLLTSNSSFSLEAGGLSEADLASIHTNVTVAENVVRYVRGGINDVLDNMQGLSVNFFDRGGSRIGTIAGSTPVLQRVRNLGWAQLPANQGGGSVYADFVRAKEDLPRVVYVGSNLGVLHAFDVDTGEELFGYVPGGVFGNLYRMATSDFQFTVDGQLSLFDAYEETPTGGRWRQILVGTLGAGGKSIYALDVTDPENPSVMWEIGPDDLPQGQEDRLGFTFGTTQVARLKNGDWALVAGNGYHSDRGRASLVVIDLFGGSVTRTVEVNNQGNNGLSSPRVARDVVERGSWDRWAYAGDLRGNLWRFDLGESLASNVSRERVFQGSRPITMQPQTIYPEEGNGYIVAFGTGKYFELGDDNIQGSPTEYLYVIRDGGSAGPSASGLQQSNLVNRSNALSGSGQVTDFNLFARNNQGFVNDGWYAALDYGGRNGARALFTPDFRLGRLLFTSFRPSEEACEVGGESRVYMMNLRTASGAFPTGNGNTSSFVGSVDGAPVTASYVTRVDTVDGDVQASTAISFGSTLEEIDDPEFDEDALPRAFGERLNWRQTR